MESKLLSLRMSSILIQYATASPVSGDSEGTSFNVRRSIPKGGSASAAAAASGDAILGMLKEGSRCRFFEGEVDSDEARLAIVCKKEKRMSPYVPSSLIPWIVASYYRYTRRDRDAEEGTINHQ